MKVGRGFRAVCLCLTGGHLAAAEFFPTPALTGIVRVGGRNQALLEIQTPDRSGTMTPILGINARVQGWSVTAIDEATATVSVEHNAQQWTLSLPQSAQISNRALNLRGAALRQVLEVYQMISGMTVLREPTLPEVLIDLATGANLQEAEVVALLDQALADKGIITQPRHGKYALMVRSTNPGALRSIPDPPAASEASADNAFPAGMLRLSEADAEAVLPIYQEVSGRTVLRPNRLPGVQVTVHNQTGLNRAEVAWVLETLLRMGGIRMVSQGERFAFAVPASFPIEQEVPGFNEKTLAAKIRQARPPATLQLTEVASGDFLALYAKLVGRDPEAVPRFLSHLKFSLHSQGALTQCESIYALEALAALSYCRLQFTEGGGVELAAGPGLKRPAPPANLRVTAR